jgi:membrane-associated phospholipid phosphatase
MAAAPWFSSWNYDVLQTLVTLLPHNRITDDCCQALLLNPLLSSWLFAACFYRYWIKDDEKKTWRQCHLLSAVVAFGFGGLITLIVRPWIHWPAPVLNPQFQSLFPRYLWGEGNDNCFPSHSTLAYFTIAGGFWPLNRRLSLWLSVLTLLLISLPRVYAGGHYPIDVIFSCFLAIVTLVAVWHLPVLCNALQWRSNGKLGATFQDFMFFLWVFELGEGFRSLEFLVNAARRAFS